MPGTFFPGEAQKRGVPIQGIGPYLAVVGVTGGLGALVAPFLLRSTNALDLQRMSVLIAAIAAVLQSFGNLIPDGTGFGVYMSLWRVLEGPATGIAEACSITALMQAFPTSELPVALGVFEGARPFVYMIGAPLGGYMYSAGGAAAPFLVAGLASFVCIAFARLLSARHLRALGAPDSQVTLMRVLRAPRVLTLMFIFFTAFFVYTGLEAIWQLWLGAPPYCLSSNEIGTVPIVSAVAFVVSAAGLAPLAVPHLGNVLTSCVGLTTAAIGSLMLGVPPLIFPAIALTRNMSYVVVIVLSTGLGMTVTPASPLTVRAIREVGITKVDGAAPLAALTVLFTSGSSIAPIVVTQLIAWKGIAAAGIFFACALAVMLLVTLFSFCDWLTFREIE